MSEAMFTFFFVKDTPNVVTLEGGKAKAPKRYLLDSEIL